MTKPKMKKSEVLDLIGDYNIGEGVTIVGMRGYYKKTMGDPTKNDRNIYDDAIFIVTKDGFWPFNANTDPSVFRKGIANLKPGIHPYRLGNHGISRPGGGYPALRPATPGEKLPVVRDGQGDSMGIAINIHKGSYKTTSSEGCQTIIPSQWTEFIERITAEMTTRGQRVVDYILIEV